MKSLVFLLTFAKHISLCNILSTERNESSGEGCGAPSTLLHVSQCQHSPSILFLLEFCSFLRTWDLQVHCECVWGHPWAPSTDGWLPLACAALSTTNRSTGEMGPHPELEHDWSKLKMVTSFSLISDSSRGEPLSSPAKNIAGTSVEDLCYMFSTLKKRREAEQKNLFSSHGHRVRA